jgi:hypothetical protein
MAELSPKDVDMQSLANRSFLVGIVVVAGSLLPISREAHASTIVDLGAAQCDGVIICAPLIYPDGTLTLTAEGGTFATKTRNGATGLGVRGRTRGEIDVNEFVHGVFSSEVLLDAFTVLFLYNGGEFGDPSEIAQISINGGSTIGTLRANAENTAVWSLGGSTVTSCGDTSITGTGCFRISNPFGDTLIADISFTAVSAASNLQNDSDYSLGSLEVAAVPEPASLVLLATGAAGLIARHGRRRRATHLAECRQRAVPATAPVAARGVL